MEHSPIEYGRLSVMLQWRHDMQRLFTMPPTAFDPPPRVESAIVREDHVQTLKNNLLRMLRKLHLPGWR